MSKVWLLSIVAAFVLLAGLVVTVNAQGVLPDETGAGDVCIIMEPEDFPDSPSGAPLSLFEVYYLAMDDTSTIQMLDDVVYFEDGLQLCGLTWNTQYHITIRGYAEWGNHGIEEYAFPIWVYTSDNLSVGLDDMSVPETFMHTTEEEVVTYRLKGLTQAVSRFGDGRVFAYEAVLAEPLPEDMQETFVKAVATSTPKPAPTATPTSVPLVVSNGDMRTYSVSGSTYTVQVAPLQVGDAYPKYVRREWGSGWNDADRNCRSTRHDVLVDESLISPTFKTNRNCSVVSGEWFGVFTGETFTSARQVDIDHMVPLSNAHKSGGWAWDRSKRILYYNDRTYDNHLLAVKSSANRKKGDKSPDQWKPTREAYHCQYAINWLTIKSSWELTVTEDEADALEAMVRTCP